MDLVLAVVRRWARFRGEQCVNTLIGSSPPCSPGEELIVGNRCYVITRVLRTCAQPHSSVWQWEVWGRRQPGARQR